MVEQVVPRYRQATFAQKILLLDVVVEVSAYTRTYAITLLNQTAERTHTIPQHSPFTHTRSEVLQVPIFTSIELPINLHEAEAEASYSLS